MGQILSAEKQTELQKIHQTAQSSKMTTKLAFLIMFLFFAELSAEKTKDNNLSSVPQADFEIFDTYGQSALHLAAWAGNANKCRFLLKNGVKVNAVDNFGKTALMLAAAYNHVEAVQAILEFNPDTEIKDRYENSVLNVATPECARSIRKHQISEKVKNHFKK